MKVQVTLTRTDTGATTKIRSDSSESSKEYSSWNDALIDASISDLLMEWRQQLQRPFHPDFHCIRMQNLIFPCLATRALFPGRHRQHDNFVSAILSRRQTAARLSPLVYRFYSRVWFAIPCRGLLRHGSSQQKRRHRKKVCLRSADF